MPPKKSAVRQKKSVDRQNFILHATKKGHMGSLIMLHGYGDTSHERYAKAFAPYIPATVRLVCPPSPMMKIKDGEPLKLPSWFSMGSWDFSEMEDNHELENAAAIVRNCINNERRLGIPLQNIAIGGYGQGAALALYVGLTMSEDLCAIISLSGWLPLRNIFHTLVNRNIPTPILQCHGGRDAIVPLNFAEQSKCKLLELATSVEFHKYEEMTHSVCKEELEDIKTFINKVFKHLIS